jgi:hypothetical protein
MNNRMPRRARLISFGLILLSMLALCPAAPAQRPGNPRASTPQSNQPPKPIILKIRVEEDRVTADIVDCPFQKALQELADRTGIIFEVRTQNNPLVSVHLQRIPLQEAIQRIASDCNTVFLYGPDQQESERPKLVRIYHRTNPIQQPSIVYLGTGNITKTSEGIETQEQALKALEGKASIQDREKAIEVLANTKDDVAVDALMRSINDAAPEIRVAAIEGLAVMGAHTALPRILKMLKDAHPGVRQSAVTAVASLGDSRNLKDLIPLIADKDASVAAAAELAMRKLSAAEKK